LVIGAAVCNTAQPTGNAAAVHHYLALTGVRHRSLVRGAFGWRSLSGLPDPGRVLRRIAEEIHDLHAEVVAPG
jgi:hypothetical protein